MPETVQMKVNGKAITVAAGTVVAAAVAQAGVSAFRNSVEHTPRGPLCGMGVCFECTVTIDGRARQRSCLTLCKNGMEVWTDE